MVKPTRTAIGRGQDRKTTSRAIMGAAGKNKTGPINPHRQWPRSKQEAKAEENKLALSNKAYDLRQESARIQKAGERMARAQALAKTKQKPKTPPRMGHKAR
jgi:hypothetical protein